MTAGVPLAQALPILGNSGAAGIGQGTSFPSTPNSNQLFFRTDASLKLLFYWTGTLWLTINEYTLSGNPISVVAPYTVANSIIRWPVRQDLGTYPTGLKTDTFVSSTNDASNFWTITVSKTSSSGVDTTLVGGSFTTATDSADTWVNHDTVLGEQISSTAFKVLTLKIAPTGAPGSLNLTTALVFRLIGV